MRFLALSILLLFSVGYTLADNNIYDNYDNGGNNNGYDNYGYGYGYDYGNYGNDYGNYDNTGTVTLSADCSKEVEKYQQCINLLISSSTTLNTSTDMKKYCMLFESNECTTFLKDVNVTTSACIKYNSDNYYDISTGVYVLSYRVSYNSYCAKGNDGKYCPFSQYLLNNYESANSDTTSSSSNNSLNQEGEVALSNDCKDNKCHERMVALKSMSDTLSGLSAQSTDNDINIVLKKYYNYYSKNKCGDIISVPTPSTECKKDVDKYRDCLSQVSTTLDTTKNIETFCKSFEIEKCKTFVNEVNNPSKCNTSKSNDSSFFLNHSSMKLSYNIYCAKGSSGSVCPFSKYLRDNVETLTDDSSFSSEGKEALAKDCKDTKCYNRMMGINSVRKTLTAKAGTRDLKLEARSASGLLDGVYFDYYTNKQCDVITTLTDTDTYNPKATCNEETQKYESCIDSVLESQGSINSASEVDKFCTSFNTSKCTSFLNESSSANSACINDYLFNKNNTGLVNGVLFTSIKIAYNSYCAKDSFGVICPYSQYVRDEFDSIGKTTSLSNKGLEALSEDCKSSMCHSRMTAAKTMFDTLKKVSETDKSVTTDGFKSLELIEDYYRYYVNNNCKDIYSSADDYSNVTCAEEIEKYGDCLYYIPYMRTDTADDIKAVCNAFATNNYCYYFIGDSAKSSSACLNEYFNSNNNVSTNELQIQYGALHTSMKMFYSMYCANDSNGKLCPFTQYIQSNFDEVGNYNNVNNIPTEGMEALVKDCNDTQCSERLISIKKMSDELVKLSNSLEGTGYSLEKQDSELINSIYEYYKDKECDALTQIIEDNNMYVNNCEEEIEKYRPCLEKIPTLDISSEGSIRSYCANYESSLCRDFIKETTKSSSCDLVNNDNSSNDSTLTERVKYITKKINYSTYCARDSFGTLCPLSQFLTEGPEALALNTTTIKLTKNSTMTEIIDNTSDDVIPKKCLDANCHSRLVGIKTSFDAYKKNNVTLITMDNVDTINKFYEYYSNRKCSGSSFSLTKNQISWTFISMIFLAIYMLL